jgi:hypothetical protein
MPVFVYVLGVEGPSHAWYPLASPDPTAITRLHVFYVL